ncbi:hypothetical protein Ccrd_008651 [Cynara cardunculus var. scolymus]|uniref:Uncharacterized protein n=1 Tax=Cynara cardunculus var. scolymus TaxID=59895 RepID=A0A103XES6_CYNCS|nr:hypothetical protein Ccrd_008651 [Cynara cardunculus var. scolymus]
MASVSLWCSARPAQPIKLGFHQNPSCSIGSSSLNHYTCRFKNAAKLLTGRRLSLVHASNKSSEEPVEAISGGSTSTAQGPPFLTILAGIVVFALVLWLFGSLISWLIGLFGLIFSK